MKTRKYIVPVTTEQTLCLQHIICASGSDRISSNVGVHGGDKSGDVATAF